MTQQAKPRFLITLEGSDLPCHKDTFEGDDLRAVLLQLVRFCLGRQARVVGPPEANADREPKPVGSAGS